MIQSEKQKHRGDEEVVKELCMANGVSYEKIAQEGTNISVLEIFFSGFPRMVGLSFFPRLCQLTVVGQNIKHIEALECCPLLQELWVVQCHLTEISGLQNCLQLEKLYLYDNQICEINNLELQINLEVLWLNNNCITQIQGLNTLQNLKELNLADNNIEKIGHSLDPNVSLQNLNLSGNKIRSFKELTWLARLPHLRELALKDPTSTPNPVCLLCNYATHVLYHMPGLQRLDTYDVSSKQVKEAAESTVMKKMMYYNMRVRTAQRNLAETRLSLTERKKTMLQLPEECVRTVNHTLKNLEHELSKVPATCKKSACTLEDGLTHLVEGSADRSDPTTDISRDPAMEHKIHSKIEALRERLLLWTRRLNEIEAWYERDLAQATNMMEYTVQFLLMELESVGNIRLEEGCSTDPWFTSCCDLLLSRFSRSDFKVHGITGIKINRVIRIHNSALRLRFEDKLHTLLASDESATTHRNYRRRLEHLFYTADPEKGSEKEEILCIVEEGFKTAEQYKALEREGIPLSNSLSVTEQPRIEHALRQARQGDSKHSTDTIPFRHGQIIVSKVFVGQSMPVRMGERVDRSSHHRAYSVYRNVDTKQRTAVGEERPRSSKAQTGPECTPRRRQWFMFEHELVLPEYIIYFDYISGDQEQPALSGHGTGRDDSPSNDIILDKEVLNMEPVLKPQPKLLSLDDKILLNVARANVLSQITVLNLHGNSLSKIKEISRLTALQHLTISFNEFTRLDDISHMPNLEFLDASYNRLVALEGLRGLGQLKHLDVRWNKLTNAREDTAVLRKHTPALLKLDTRYNPWNRPEAVRMTILGRLITLTHLDDMMVAEEEAAVALQMAAGSKINQASLLAHSRTDSDRPRSLSLLSTARLLCLLSPAPWGLNRELELDWTAMITALNLDSQRISRLINLNKLVNLRWASFNDNDISKVEGLDSCLKLEELSLNNNNISTLNGLSKLHCLNKLSVDGNQLSSLDASVLDQLPNLSFLSVEDNCISSLHGIQRVRSLLELYIGNNHISTSQDIYFLKGLTNLIILDLYGNPLLEKLENYRIYVVFHLPSLKALDGIAVEVTECESAKDMFGGRLTPDMIAEKLGHSNYTDITYLTLQSCSIRMVDLCPADLFCSLRSVNLDHNNLTSFSGLIYLPNIKALCLNYNHIESILPRQKTHMTNRQILHSKVHSSGYGQQSPSKGKGETGPTGSLEPLMGSLEVLHLSHNGISNMANLQLSRLTNLKALFLQGNEISQVEGLEGLHRLRELGLDRNRIKALAENSFIAQNVLLELHLAENRIRELNHLDPLTELRKLFLGMNKLQEITELDKLEVLPSLMELSVVGNPVAKNSLHRPAVVLHLSQLQVLDGVMVTLEERTRAELLSTDSSPCSQCPGASLPATEINLPGLLPLMPRHNPLRGMSMSGGLQNFMHGHDVLPSNVDEAQSHYTYKHKKHKHGNAARSGQTDITFRHIRKAVSNLTTTGLLPDGNRVIVTYPNQEQDSRFPNSGKPPSM
ncbi:leucine-rich repeat-containing protein 9 isoform X1 [Dicentrarchus labrax]|uniref:leucine-rich repeat-containing protein 9 isoform X1 n=1 Tax=Dicentrarchus labrax TaxID=13489 RepID=UPI0021F59348|nr:leucine-rich repeat-containing protein 9 isoform X1 [Dicentrarchus labrax]XP_051237092.1 leucine-rich repeat-containing protein 9 isoform X1 [Dicentrarchus labrax]